MVSTTNQRDIMVYFKEYFKGYPPGGGRWSQESLYWQPVSSSKEVVVGRGLKGLTLRRIVPQSSGHVHLNYF